MKITTRTEQFEAAHGRKPAGRGYWVLTATVDAGERGYTDAGDHPYYGTLAEAKRVVGARVARMAREQIGGATAVILHVNP